MKGFLKVFGAIITAFSVILGALAVFDKINNKNRIKGNYLDCEVDSGDDYTEE